MREGRVKPALYSTLEARPAVGEKKKLKRNMKTQ
jgi:hypothetical protein